MTFEVFKPPAMDAFVIDYIRPGSRRVIATSLEEAAKAARDFARKDNVTLLSVKRAEVWADDEIKKLREGKPRGTN